MVEEKPSTTEDTEDKKEKVEVSSKFNDLLGQIEGMTVLELSDLVKALEDKFGVSAAAPVAAVAAAGAGALAGAGAAEEEKSVFTVVLAEVGPKKINVIKEIRVLTSLGLKEAKDMADGAPIVLKEGVKKEEAEEIKKKIEDAGGVAELK